MSLVNRFPFQGILIAEIDFHGPSRSSFVKIPGHSLIFLNLILIFSFCCGRTIISSALELAALAFLWLPSLAIATTAAYHKVIAIKLIEYLNFLFIIFELLTSDCRIKFLEPTKCFIFL